MRARMRERTPRQIRTCVCTRISVCLRQVAVPLQLLSVRLLFGLTGRWMQPSTGFARLGAGIA
eukprot:6190730-Pleurochrysis_carterae.AAC.1